MEIISLNKINKSYGAHVIFQDYSLNINEGDFIALMGRSGSGKSTLLNMVGLLDRPDSGEIIICGIRNPSIHSKAGISLLRYKISYLFQNYGLLEDRSVEYNVKMAMRFSQGITKKSVHQTIAHILEKVDLSGFEKKKIYQLSGGEQQRVALARILAKPTEIILADEPTGSLDPINREIVMGIIADLNSSGKTVLMVTHDEVAASYAKCIKKI